MKGTNEQVVNDFYTGLGKYTRNGTYSLYWERYENHDVIYSYGNHWPLAVRLHRDNEPVIINGDGFTQTTITHRNLVVNAFEDNPAAIVTSFGILNRVLSGALPPERLRAIGNNDGMVVVVNAIADGTIKVIAVVRDKWSLDEPPKGELGWTAVKVNNDGDTITWHRAGGMLFTVGDDYYVSGMDDENYFASKLSRLDCMVNPPKTVGEALQLLKPALVRQYEQRTGYDAVRQGEWFFLPMKDVAPDEYNAMLNGKSKRTIYKKMSPNFVLPRDDFRSNPHTPTRGGFCGGYIVVSGTVRHPEHRQVVLSYSKDPEFFVAVKNTAEASWSVSGVD